MRSHCLDCKEFLKPKEYVRCSTCLKLKQSKQLEEAKRRKKISIAEWRMQFRIPNSTRIPELNCVYPRTHNSIEHEIGKLKEALEHQKKGHIYMTECQRPDGIINDLECYSCGTVEVVATHGDLARYQREGTQVRKV